MNDNAATENNTPEVKPEYIGLWAKNDKNGETFLNGSDDKLVYFIFKDRDGGRSLHTTPRLPKGSPKGKFTKVGMFETVNGEHGEFQKLNNMCIFPNEKRTEENHPDFNLVIYNK